MPKKPTIEDIRKRIDAIDDQVLQLLKDRIDCAKRIGILKDESSRAKWDPKRELEIFTRLQRDNNGVFPEKSLFSIFHEIITTCRLSQKNIKVAYMGPEATFSHLAGVKYFGHSADYKPMESIEEVFREVEKGRTSYGVVPVENSIEGAVSSTLDSFMKYNVKICGEIQLPITHNLVCRSGNIEDVQTVASHSQPLAQCREWLHKNLPKIPTLPVFSTAAAAQMAANNPNIGAITSSLAIDTYELQLVVKGIEDYPGSGNDKTSVLLGLLDRPGALNEVLTILSSKNINLAKIESRPVKGKQWTYLFFLDMIGHIEDPVIQEAGNILRRTCAYYEWLGSYPLAENIEP